MAGRLKKEKQKIYLSQGNLKKKMIPRIFFMAYLGINVIVLTGIPVYASDIFATAKNAMQTVYTDVAGIATVAAVVCAAVCLFLMNFSKSGRTVDESRSWLKRIVVCWAALMTLGAIVTYLESEHGILGEMGDYPVEEEMSDFDTEMDLESGSIEMAGQESMSYGKTGTAYNSSVAGEVSNAGEGLGSETMSALQGNGIPSVSQEKEKL